MTAIRDRMAGWLALFALICQVCSAQEPAPTSATPTAEAVAPAAAAAAAAAATVEVVLHTALGDIHFALERDRAPVSTANFLRYVDQKRFDNSSFYRAVKISEDGKY